MHVYNNCLTDCLDMLHGTTCGYETQHHTPGIKLEIHGQLYVSAPGECTALISASKTD